MLAKTLLALAVLPVVFLGALFVGARSSCGCGTMSRAERVGSYAELAWMIWQRDGRCPKRDDLLAELPPRLQVPRLVILCSDPGVTPSLVVLDPGPDDDIGTRDDVVGSER